MRPRPVAAAARAACRTAANVVLPFVLFVQLFLGGDVSAFLFRASTSTVAEPHVRLRIANSNSQIDSAISKSDVALGEDVASSVGKHAVIGSTHMHPTPRDLRDFPALNDAFIANEHAKQSQEELGRGLFIMSDWRKAWYTYGQCDRSLTQEEYERIRSADGFVVDPRTGNADYEIEDIDGKVPEDLVGVLYRNGPGKFGVNGDRVAHILDADGMVLRFEFRPPDETPRVKFNSRFVETEGFVEEREANKFVKRGTFGTCARSELFAEPSRRGLNEDPEKPPMLSRMAANAFQVDIKNTANTQVVAYGGKLLALWEAGLPYRLDPVTLETIGMDPLGLNIEANKLGKIAVNYIPGLPEEFQPDFLGGKAHTAHPKVCPRTGNLVGWSWASNPNDGSMEVTFTEYESDGFRVVASETQVLENCDLAPHDMILTENFIVLKINSLEMEQFPFLSGAKGPAECLSMNGRSPVRAFVFPRPSSDKAKDFIPFVVDDIPPCFSIHFSHGYEDEKTGNIVAYFSGWPPNDSKDFLGAWGGFCPDYDVIPPTFFWRLEIDVKTKKFADLRVSPGAENICCEHPVVHPNFQTKAAAYAYAQCCNAIGDASAPVGLAKFVLDGSVPAQPYLDVGMKNEEVDVFWLGARRFAGEPLVVPKRCGNMEREQEAYLLALVYDSVRNQSSLVVFDLERELKEGPVCTIWLKTALPHGLHGCFAPDTSLQTSYFC